MSKHYLRDIGEVEYIEPVMSNKNFIEDIAWVLSKKDQLHNHEKIELLEKLEDLFIDDYILCDDCVDLFNRFTVRIRNMINELEGGENGQRNKN